MAFFEVLSWLFLLAVASFWGSIIYCKRKFNLKAELRELLILSGITFLPLLNLPQQSLILDYDITSSDSFLLRDVLRDISLCDVYVYTYTYHNCICMYSRKLDERKFPQTEEISTLWYSRQKEWERERGREGGDKDDHLSYTLCWSNPYITI